jgi:glucose-1-phosphate cytidylyltransferase
MMKNMKVVILCGGEGTRLNEYTVDIPKPLIEIGGKPIIWHIMKIYSHYGFDEFILCLGYKGGKIKDYFQKNNFEFKKIMCVETGQKSTKAERLKMVEKYVGEEENFFLAYGDDVSNVNIQDVLDFHLKNKKIATITSVNLMSQYGILEINKINEITNFNEKPTLNYWINGGFFVLNKKIFDIIENGKELENDIFRELSEKRQICAFKHKGFWKSMNTLKDVKELNDIWKSGKIPWKVWK